MHLRKKLEIFMDTVGGMRIVPAVDSEVMRFLRGPVAHTSITAGRETLDQYGTPWNQPMRFNFLECREFTAISVVVRENKPYWTITFHDNNLRGFNEDFWFDVRSLMDIAGRTDLIHKIDPKSKVSTRDRSILSLPDTVF